jgi:putative lipoic acid-binding regulatory protein
MFTRLTGKPDIAYPCTWTYKLFGMDREEMRRAVEQTIAGAEYTLTFSRSSRHGKYHCMNLAIPVASEQDRDAIYQALVNHTSFVLIL